MIRWSLVLVLLMGHAVEASAQQQTSTWSIAKPVVEEWDTEYRNSGRSLASRTKIVGQIHQLLQTHHTEIWAYEAAALGFNRLNLNDDVVSVIRNYLQRFPEDETLIERVWFFSELGEASPT